MCSASPHSRPANSNDDADLQNKLQDHVDRPASPWASTIFWQILHSKFNDLVLGWGDGNYRELCDGDEDLRHLTDASPPPSLSLITCCHPSSACDRDSDRLSPPSSHQIESPQSRSDWHLHRIASLPPSTVAPIHVDDADWNPVRCDSFLTSSWDDYVKLWTVDRPSSIHDLQSSPVMVS